MFWEILKASKGLPVDDPIAALWGQKMSGGWAVTELTGELPLAFLSDGGALKNYRIYGTAGGAGVQTENLWDGELEQGSFNSSGEEAASTARIRSDYIYIQNSDNYTIKLTGAEGVVVYVYDANKSFLSAESTMGWRTCPFTREIEANRYVRFAFAKSSSGTFEEIVPSDVSNIMLVPGSTAPASYIPPGYKIPIIDTSGVTENLFSGKGETRNIGAASVKQFVESNMQISPGETYCINASSALYSRLGLYMNGTRVSNSNWVSTQSSITIPDSCNNMYVEVRNYAYDAVTDEQLATATEIMLTSGSTPPDHYIPHRYETDYNLYIGDSKLGEEEYVEFRSKRADKLIYDRTSIDDASLRRIRMIIDAENSTVLPAGITYASTGLIAYRGTECPKLTRESAAAHDDIYDYNLPAAQFQTTARDTKGGIFYRGYAILSDGTLIYGDTVGCTLNEQATEIIETLRIVSTDIPLYPTIWKRTENLWDGVIVYGEGLTNPPHADPEQDQEAFAPSSSTSHSDKIAVLPNKTYTIKFQTRTTISRSIYAYDSNGAFLRVMPSQIPIDQTYWTFTTLSDQYYLIFPFNIDDTQLMLTEGSTAPSSYISYLQPTDPPAPLPAINTYKGENTLSSTETVGSVTIRGRIKEST